MDYLIKKYSGEKNSILSYIKTLRDHAGNDGLDALDFDSFVNHFETDHEDKFNYFFVNVLISLGYVSCIWESYQDPNSDKAIAIRLSDYGLSEAKEYFGRASDDFKIYKLHTPINKSDSPNSSIREPQTLIDHDLNVDDYEKFVTEYRTC